MTMDPTDPSPPTPLVGVPLVGSASELFAALAKAQADFAEIHRTRTVRVTTKMGGAYSFDYAPLEDVLAACVPALNRHGLALIQPLAQDAQGRLVLHTILTHASGASLQATLPLPAMEDLGGEGIKRLGSLITYLRRYAVQSLLGVAAEADDDAGAASGDETVPVNRPNAKPRLGSMDPSSSPAAPASRSSPTGPRSTPATTRPSQPPPPASAPPATPHPPSNPPPSRGPLSSTGGAGEASKPTSTGAPASATPAATVAPAAPHPDSTKVRCEYDGNDHRGIAVGTRDYQACGKPVTAEAAERLGAKYGAVVCVSHAPELIEGRWRPRAVTA